MAGEVVEKGQYGNVCDKIDICVFFMRHHLYHVLLARQLSAAHLQSTVQADTVNKRLVEVADAQAQINATTQHTKSVIDGISSDFYKLLLEQVAWIMVELKIAKSDRESGEKRIAAEVIKYLSPQSPNARSPRDYISVKAFQAMEAKMVELSQQQQQQWKTQLVSRQAFTFRVLQFVHSTKGHHELLLMML